MYSSGLNKYYLKAYANKDDENKDEDNSEGKWFTFRAFHFCKHVYFNFEAVFSRNFGIWRIIP